MQAMNSAAERISVFTRADALSDGILSDVSKIAEEEGFKVPVALTLAAYRAIEPSEEEKSRGDDLRARLHDLFRTMHQVLRRKSYVEASRIDFQLNLFQDGEHYSLALRALLHLGDRGEPVITILLPNED